MKDHYEQEEIFSQVLRAGRRTYFFDVRSTKADDYYLTITESKKFTQEDGSYHYQKHKVYLYKEDFSDFKEMLEKATSFIIKEKGEEVISERHNKRFDSENTEKNETVKDAVEEGSSLPDSSAFTDVKFEDI